MIEINFGDLVIKKIGIDSVDELTDLMQKEDSEYSRYFIPFRLDYLSIKEQFSRLRKDVFWGIAINNKLVGFYMLRGFDEGYDIPSYGVWISKEFSGKGLSKLTLQHAIAFCKLNKIKKLMLKVHPENIIAKNIYEDFGFKQTGIDPKNNHLIYHKKLL